MVSWVDSCPVCGKSLPFRGNRRVAIPWLKGRKRTVHPECAELVEQQQTLDVRKAS
jgi:hypothetical protein